MTCCFEDLRGKEIIQIKTGCKIGFVDDVEFETRTAKICNLIVYGRARVFGLFGREDDYVIPWGDIDIIGEDTILVSCDFPQRTKKRVDMFKNLLK
ncbi:MAG: YlmC/YmxH family sporulation protein [Oscillospiraceae bacterium]|nr:YlmC/YmxH family sporulation protein [Oscillospiraceae bacterium]